MPYTMIDGQSLYYRTHDGDLGGRRPRLVLVHGAGGTHMHWPAGLRRLPDWTVISVDLPGHGKSEGPGHASIAGYRQVIYGLCHALNLGPIVLAGHSMGSAIALDFALHYPKRLSGLVLVGAGAKLRVAPAILDGLQNDFPGTAQLITDWAHAKDAPAQMKRLYLQRLLQNDPQVLHGDYVACDRFDLRADLGRIAAPTLVVCGTADVMTPPRFSEYLAEHLPHARVHWVEGAGHMVMFEASDETTATVQSFLAGLA